jgi:hypothetical protein
MPHCPKPRRQISRGAKPTNNHQPDNTPFISDAVRSWIKNVIAPALAQAYLKRNELRKGGTRA